MLNHPHSFHFSFTPCPASPAILHNFLLLISSHHPVTRLPRPITLPGNPLAEGHLLQWDSSVEKWIPVYCVLKTDLLYTYADKSRSSLLDIFKLSAYDGERDEESQCIRDEHTPLQPSMATGWCLVIDFWFVSLYWKRTANAASSAEAAQMRCNRSVITERRSANTVQSQRRCIANAARTQRERIANVAQTPQNRSAIATQL
jgi:hypothetical protein